MRGRPAKPTAELKTQGTYRADRHANRADEELAIGDPVKPKFVDDRASKMWDLVVAGLPGNAKAQIDTPLLTGMCRWWCKWCDYIEDENGDEYKNLVMAATAWKQFERLAARFGMSPADRAKLKISPAQPNQDDLLTEMLKARSN